MAFDKEKALTAAQKYIDKEQYEKAVRELQKIVEVEPDDERTLLRLATCYESLNKPSDAGSTYYKIAQTYRDKGAYQKALAILKQAQKCTPDDDDVAMGMAELYSALGLPHEAVSQLEKCLNRSSREANPCVYLKILQMMVRVDGENVQTRTRYAQALYEDGDFDGSKRQYTLALAQLLSKERYVDYIQISRDYLKIEPKDVDVLCELAHIYVQMERYNEALVLLSDLKTNEERTPDVREIAIGCYKKLRRNNDAVRELKALAHQLEDQGDRPDLVEEVWNRALALAPNDPEILAAISGEPPMLSDSALNVVSPGLDGMGNGNTTAIPEISQAERELAMKFSRALEAYRGGRLDEARFLCQQIVECNEQHVSALQLLSQIFESVGDMVSQAQIERKLAKAVVDEDPDEAVRHVLKAEKCTPRAWENFNLLLVFGVEPSDYGLSAPEMTKPASSHSNPMIPARQMGGMSAVSAIPAPSASIPAPPASIPAPPQGRPSVPPPIPPRGIPAPSAGKPVPPVGRPPVPPPIRPVSPSGAFAKPLEVPAAAPFEQRDISSEKTNTGASPYQVSEVTSASSERIGNDVAALSDAVTEELDDMFDSLYKTPSNKSSKPDVVSELVSDAVQTPEPAPEFFQNPIPERAETAGRPASGNLPPVTSSISGIRGAVPGASSAVNAAVTGIRGAVPGAVTGVSGIRGAVPGITGTASGASGIRGAVPGITGTASGASGIRGAVPGISGTASGASGIRGTVLNGTRTSSPSNPFAAPGSDRNAAAMTPVAQNAVPPAGFSRTVAPIQPRVAESSVGARNRATTSVVPNDPSLLELETKPAAIPESELQRVKDALLEIDFYASLMLVDDAKKLLQELIDEFGEADIILDAKKKIDALG